MDLKRKLEIVTTAVQSISQHSDEDAAVVQAALAKVEQMVAGERQLLEQRVAADIAAKFAK